MMDTDLITDVGTYAGGFVGSITAFGLWSWMRDGPRGERIEWTDRIDRR